MIANATHNPLQPILFNDYLTPLLEPLGWMLVHSLWQLTLVAMLFFIVRTFVRAIAPRNHAASLYWIGCASLLVMLVLPAVTLIGYLNQTAEVVSELPASFASEAGLQAGEPLVSTNSLGWQLKPAQITLGKPVVGKQESRLWITAQGQMRVYFPWLVSLWFAGVILLSMRPMLGLFNVQRLGTQGLSPLPETILYLCQSAKSRMGIQRAVKFAQSTLVEIPVVVGYFKPVVLLPASVVTGMTTNELELILAHELAHVRRNDYVMNLMQTVVETLLFFHPAVWVISAQIRHERENCCDDLAVGETATSEERASLARALLNLEQRRTTTHLLAASGNGNGSLIKRVRRLLGQPVPQKSQLGSVCFSLALMVTLLLLAILCLFTSPSDSYAVLAQQPTETASQDEPVSIKPAATSHPVTDEPVAEKQVARTYYVGDLIVPLQATLLSRASWPVSKLVKETLPEKLQKKTHEPALPPASVSQWVGGIKAQNEFTKTDFKPFVNLITSLISPDSWEIQKVGGKAKIEFSGPKQSLIVSTTEKIHAQLKDLLAKLREIGDVTIELRSSFLLLPKADLKRLDISEQLDGEEMFIAGINGRVVRKIQAMAAAESDWKTHQNPAVALFNGQQVKFGWKAMKELEPGYIDFTVLLSDDRKAVRSYTNIFQDETRVSGANLTIATNRIGLLDVSQHVLPEDSDQAVLLFFRTLVIDNGPG